MSGGAIARDLNDGLSVEVDVVEPTGQEARNVMRLGDQTIVGVFRERIPAKSKDSV